MTNPQAARFHICAGPGASLACVSDLCLQVTFCATWDLTVVTDVKEFVVYLFILKFIGLIHGCGIAMQKCRSKEGGILS